MPIADSIAGVEINYQNVLHALPSPFDGLGTNVNYTCDRLVGHASSAADDDLPFFKQSDHIGNAAVLYAKYGIEDAAVRVVSTARRSAR